MSDEVVDVTAARRALVVRRAAAQMLVHQLRNDVIGVGEGILGLTVGSEVVPTGETVFPLLELVAAHAVGPEILTDRLTKEILSATMQLEDLP